ncbi:penicillin acylase family protein [Leucobacter iarius]|uniref:Penicillin acylase family protein n=1 Tax=Leucobacter iarius TaxID=333963 RepID=A0ABN2LIF0_9MICO
MLGWVLAALVVIALVAAGLGAWTVARSFPQTTGTLPAEGLDRAVTVQRDASGIPTITADTGHDLFFAQGFVHAQDRFWEMDFRRHLTSGQLAELFGESQVGTDKFLRTLGWHRIAEQEVRDLPKEVRAYYEAYADGVNAYLAQRSGADLSLEYAVLDLQNPGYAPEKWTPADSVAWFKAMAWDLRTNVDEESTRALLARTLDPESLAELYPPYPFSEHPTIVGNENGNGSGSSPANAGSPAAAGSPASATGPIGTAGLSEDAARAIATVDALIGAQGEGIGSNSWVVSGVHTATGEPLLANDPHLGAALPSVWTQMQLRCSTVGPDCPFAVAGFSFSGLPGIVIGHNERVAWGFTNLTTDVADLYVERIDGDRYWKDGKLHPLETRRETLKVAGGPDVEFQVRTTGHGPVVSGLTDDFTAIAGTPRIGRGTGSAERAEAPGAGTARLSGEYAVSLRWTALDPGTTAEAIFRLDRAEDYDDFRAAAEKFDVPAQNLIYADVDGNIGYQAPGRLPIRGAGDGWLPQPGWDSVYDWTGFIPFEELPRSYNPPAGYIVTANNAIVPDSYPYFLSRDWDYGYRAARITALLDRKIAEGPITADDLREIQADDRMPAAASLRRAYAGISVEDPKVQAALDGLRDWDEQNRADSPVAAFANVLWNRVTALMVGGGSTAIPRDDQSRFAVFFSEQLRDPGSRWWRNAKAGITSRDALLERAANEAYAELVRAQGSDASRWNWGELHALTLRSGTFGKSGIAPIEALFNRGPFPVGGGSGVVNATGWGLDEGYETSTVPSMRMVVDVSDWDASQWINLTGASGHAFHPHYTDQTGDWAAVRSRPWVFSAAAVSATTRDTLRLEPR